MKGKIVDVSTLGKESLRIALICDWSEPKFVCFLETCLTNFICAMFNWNAVLLCVALNRVESK